MDNVGARQDVLAHQASSGIVLRRGHADHGLACGVQALVMNTQSDRQFLRGAWHAVGLGAGLRHRIDGNA